MSQSIVQTVTGPVPAQDIGIADAHSHLWIDAVAGADPAAPQLNDEALLLDGLKAYSLAGGQAIVDCQPAGCGRDANHLYRLSTASGVKIIACTGFHRRRYYGPQHPLWQMAAGEASDFFRSEAEEGLVETRARPGVIRPGFIKIAAERTLVESPTALFEAAAAVNKLTGLAIEMHTERGADAEFFLAFFAEQGVLPERLIFCHMDKRPDFGLHTELAQAGVMLEYDTFFRPKYEPERHVWPLLRQMIAAGLASSVALATDMAESALWRRPGPAAFITTIGQRLEKEGIDLDSRAKLLGGNITGRLALKPQHNDPNPVNPVDPVDNS